MEKQECWRCPLYDRRGMGMLPDPFFPDEIKLCPVCAVERLQHPNRPAQAA